MSVFLAIFKKELLLISRDLNALMALFAMPVAFVVIMSLALQDQINGRSTLQLHGVVSVERQTVDTVAMLSELKRNAFLLLEQEKTAKTLFHVHIKENFDAALEVGFEGVSAIDISYEPKLGLREKKLIFAAVSESFARVNVNVIAEQMGMDEGAAETELLKTGVIAETEGTDEVPTPNATQQNVPAWLVFAMFFISIPISNILISEKQQKTLIRLKIMNVSSSVWLCAKLFPYVLINMLQLVLVFAVGVWGLPLLGAQALNMDVSIPGIVLMGLGVSISALGFASLIAMMSKSSEQATMLTGTGSILLGAIGGIMVPSFVMPEFMQQLALASPMGWGLRGFLDLLVYQGGVMSILPEFSVLIGAGLIMMLLSSAIFRMRSEIE